jgi:hypothetical protein
MFAASFYVFLTHHWTFELVAALLDSIVSKNLAAECLLGICHADIGKHKILSV